MKIGPSLHAFLLESSSVLTSLLLEGLDGFGISRAGLESILATPLSHIKKKRKMREGKKR